MAEDDRVDLIPDEGLNIIEEAEVKGYHQIDEKGPMSDRLKNLSICGGSVRGQRSTSPHALMGKIKAWAGRYVCVTIQGLTPVFGLYF
jgi:hypothetical protein